MIHLKLMFILEFEETSRFDVNGEGEAVCIELKTS